MTNKQPQTNNTKQQTANGMDTRHTNQERHATARTTKTMKANRNKPTYVCGFALTVFVVGGVICLSGHDRLELASTSIDDKQRQKKHQQTHNHQQTNKRQSNNTRLTTNDNKQTTSDNEQQIEK